MIFPVDIMLKGREKAIVESIEVGHGEPATWGEEAVRDVLVAVLRAIAEAENPETAREKQVVLHGFSWIVEPTSEGQVVIAIEIPMGAAVAGPFTMGQQELDALIGRVLRAERQNMVAVSTIH